MANLRILLVDDFELVRVMLRDILSKLGITEIDEAEDGRKALDRINEAHSSGHPYDVVFCDWMMPELSGIEVVEACRADPDHKNLCIIMVTAEAEQGAVVQAIAAGVTDYVVKPFSPEILASKIHKIMTKKVSAAA